MNTKPLKKQALIRIGLTIAILILVNIISVRIFARMDVTDNKIYTLSDASKQAMRNLDDRVSVRAYFTEDLPAPYNMNRRELLDELNEYKAYSRGNLQFEFIDPTGEKGEQEAQQQGIQPVQVQVVKEDRFEVKRAYMGLVILYEDKKEVIPVIQNTSTLEYDITSTIKRLTTKTQKKIGFLTGQGEPPLSEVSHVKDILDKQYQVTAVDISKGKPVTSDIAALIIMAPTKRFSEPEKYQIDQYIMGGGKVAFLLNEVDASLQQRFGRATDLNIEDLLENYGLRINPDLVRDGRCASVNIVQQQFGFNIQSQVPFPYLPLVSNFNKDNMMVKDLQGIVLFFASSVDTTGLAARNLHGEIIMRTSKQSGRLTGFFTWDPVHQYTPEEAQRDFAESGIPLAALVYGQFKSFYAGKEVPKDTSAGSVPPSGNAIPMSPASRIILVGDGDFGRDQYLGNRDNLTFVANMVDYLVDDAGLITIRSKDVSMPPLEQVSDGTKKMVKYGNLVVPPLLVLGYGLFRWRARKARKKIMSAA